MQLLKQGNSQSRLPFKSSNLNNDDNGKTAAITTTTDRERERLREEYLGTDGTTRRTMLAHACCLQAPLKTNKRQL